MDILNNLKVDGTITATGDITDGSSNKLSKKLDKLTTGPTAGTYTSVTVNGEGQVTGGSNPTTLAGYGITDAVPALTTAPTAGDYTKVTINADGLVTAGTNPTTLSGYGITDAVNTTGDQTGIAGAKTWTGNQIVENNITVQGVTAQIKSTTIATEDAPTSNIGGTRLQFVPNNAVIGDYSKYIAQLVPFHEVNSTELDTYVKRIDGGTTHIKSSRLVVNSDGSGFMTAPVRTYNSANTNDIVTIGSLASNPSVMHPTYTHQEITFNAISGLTITPADNNSNSKGFELCGNILVINLALNITGTYTGTTGWQTLFDWPAGTNGIKAPYLMNVIDFSSNSCIRLHQGRYLYFTNGTTYNYQFNCQVICPYNG